MKFNTKTKQWEVEDEDEPRIAMIQEAVRRMAPPDPPEWDKKTERRKGDRRKPSTPAKKKDNWGW